jgi:hypothetical protein
MNRDLIRQAQQMQQRMQQMQEELGSETVEATAGGGAVTVVFSGHQIMQSIKIQADAMDPADPTMLEDLVMAAINEGLEKARGVAANKMSAITGGFKLPGL